MLTNVIKESEIKTWRLFILQNLMWRKWYKIDCMIWFHFCKQKMNRKIFEKKYSKMLTVVFLEAEIFFLLIFIYYFYQYAFIISRIKYDWSIKIFLKNQDLIHLSIRDDVSEEAVCDHGLLSCANMLFKFPAKDFLRFISFLLLMTIELTRAIPVVSKNSH